MLGRLRVRIPPRRPFVPTGYRPKVCNPFSFLGFAVRFAVRFHARNRTASVQFHADVFSGFPTPWCEIQVSQAGDLFVVHSALPSEPGDGHTAFPFLWVLCQGNQCVPGQFKAITHGIRFCFESRELLRGLPPRIVSALQRICRCEGRGRVCIQERLEFVQVIHYL